MIKSCASIQGFGVLAVKSLQVCFRVVVPVLLLQLILFLPLLGMPALVWAQGFESPPQVIDDADEDTVFSPNGDGVQDNLIISFVTDGFTGNYRITIDVHGPAAIGPPDGTFDVDDDWVIRGDVGPGRIGVQPPDDPKIIHQEWDGADRSPTQEVPPAPRAVVAGIYQIRVEIDAFQNGVVNPGEIGYDSVTLSAVVDINAPQLSSTVSHLNFSPNSDAIQDTTTITYTLSEDLSDLNLEFTNLTNQPAIQLTSLTSGQHSFIWNGQDGLGTLLIDGIYSLRLRSVDNGGNVTTFGVGAVQIDTETPIILQITPGQNTFLRTPIATVVVDFNPEQGSPMNFDSNLTEITLQDTDGQTLSGIAQSDMTTNRLTLTLDNPLDTISENGAYTAIGSGADQAGNQVQTDIRFTFDTVAPILEQTRSDHGDFLPNGSVNTEITFVEVGLNDNIDDGLNLSAATIALNGPSGAVLGNQTLIDEGTLRWNLHVPFATDGSDDGTYTITINATDRAGNSGNFSAIPFVYDTQTPELISLTPNVGEASFLLTGDMIFRNQSLFRLVATFSDGVGSGIDFDATRLEMFSVGETDVDEIAVAGTSVPNVAEGTLTFLLSQPLENRDGSQDGTYRIRITLVDAAGNTQTGQIDLTYDTEVPTILTTTPDIDATVSVLSRVTLVLDDPISGVDFATASFRLVREGIEVRTNASNNGRDTAVLTLSEPLATDGSDDGEYTIEITPVDRAGNVSAQIECRFFFAPQVPEIQLNTPAETEVNALTTIDAQLFDYIGAGIDFSSTQSTLLLTRADGTLIPAKSVEADEANNRLIWTIATPLPRDGSADGEYTASVSFEDFVGRLFSEDFALTFDTQLPSVNRVMPPAGARISQLGPIVVKFRTDLTGVDFAASQVRLLDPNSITVGTNHTDNGLDTITLSTDVLQVAATAGVYTIEVTPADRAGNVAGSPVQFGFTYSPREPAISLQPSDAIPTDRLDQLAATLQNYVGPGINFDAGETSISVTDANGTVVAAQPIQSNEAGLQLTWTAVSPPPRDGSADGEYTVVSRFVENLELGASSPATFERTSTLTFDTQLPSVNRVMPPAGARVSQLGPIVIKFRTDLTGVDFAASQVRLLDPNGITVGTNHTDNGLDTITLSTAVLQVAAAAGVYTIEVTPADRAGNVAGSPVQFGFTYSPREPAISLQPSDAIPTDRLDQLAATLQNYVGPGINFDAGETSISVTDANGTVVAAQPIQSNEAGLQLTWTAVSPPPRDGSADGEYTVVSRFVENLELGASSPATFERTSTLTFDTQPPQIMSTTPAVNTQITRQLNRVTVVLEDNLSGVDFDRTVIRLLNSANNTIPITPSNDAQQQVVLSFGPFKTDGSADGVYRIEITPIDLAGNVGGLSMVEFIYATQAAVHHFPEIETLTPSDQAIVNQVPEIRALIRDNSGEGIDFEKSTVTLRDLNDVDVPGILGDDEALTLTLEVVLPTDGTADGTYTINLTLVDNLGVEATYIRQFTYDSLPPTITPESRPPADNKINENQIVVEFEVSDLSPVLGEGSGVDFDATTIQLQDPNGVLITGEKKDDGVKKITFTSAELTNVGIYVLTVAVVDRAGNVGVPQRFTYTYQVDPPRVTSILPSNKSRVNRLTEITAVLEDRSGAGIDFSLSGSTIELRTPNNLAVEGDVTDNGTDAMTLVVTDPLLTDGSDDGIYTVIVQPIDQLGITGQIRQFTITYDTQNPRIQSATHIDTTANVSNVNDLVTRIEAQLSDEGSGMDFDRSSVQLWKLVESERTLVPGTLDHDDTTRTWWQLENPLSRSGEDDGTYSVEVIAVDNANNAEEKDFTLLYDTQAPQVDSIRTATATGDESDISTDTTPSLIDSPIHQVRLDFSDGDGSGIDLSQTAVQLIRPNGAILGATQQDNGIETVFLRFNPLRDDGTDDGRYILRVTPIDLAGNTFTSPVEFQFFYGTRKPEVVSTTPAEFAFVTQLSAVSAILLDYSGEGIDFDRSTIRLNAADSTLINGRQQPDAAESTITWELTEPLSRDGGDDGEYSIQLSIFDRAGSQFEQSKTFVYDTQIPQIVSVSANTTSPTPISADGLEVINESFTEMAVTLSDEQAVGPNAGDIPTSGVDFAGTIVRLLGPNNSQVGVNVRDDGDTELTVSFAPLNQPGSYTLEVIPRDLAENVSGHAIEHRFSLDLARPEVISVNIGEHTAPIEFVNQFNTIVASFADVGGTGLDLTRDGSTITVVGPAGAVEGAQEAQGADEIAWTPLQLPTDGTADGRYTVTVTPVDSTGRSGTPARHQFTYDTQEPNVASVSPIDLTQPVSYIGQQITQISMQAVDVGPAGLDITAQTIELRNTNGDVISASLTNDNANQVFLTLAQPLATNGSSDEEYTVIINLTDQGGNSRSIEHTLIYDTQAPTLVNTVPSGDLIRDDLTLITANLNDLGGSSIDFTASQLILLDPAGNQINGKLNNDGRGKLTLQLDELAADGSYRIRVFAVDRAGNGANAPFERNFLFSTSLPAVVSTMPVTAPAESAFTNDPLNQVEVEFQSSPNLSTVNLLHPNGTTVPGQQIRDGNRLIYRLARELASDGSDDGSYTLQVTPVNSAGRSGQQQQFTFIYDTIMPAVDVETILLVVEVPGVNNALNEIQAIVADADPSSVVDWDDLDDSWLIFEKVGVGDKIRGRLSSDRQQTLTFRLETPLASDGSQDGEYRVTVTPMDRAGNIAEPVIFEFFYDTRPPVIDIDSLQINDQPLFVDTNHPDYPSAAGSGSGVVIQARLSDLGADDGTGLGVDLARSSITLLSPDGTSITGNLTQNGTDTVIFKSGPLTAQGLYQVTVTSVGLDIEALGFTPTDSITTQFLHETTIPIAELTDFGGEATLTDEPLPLRGTAQDPATGIVEVAGGQQVSTIPASGLAFVEIVGIGPGGVPIDPVPAIDDSQAEEEPWSRWSVDFLPAQSGRYNLDIRVTDRAGNSAVYDGVNANLSVSLTFRGSTYGWPNPLQRSTGDQAHFSFDVNVPGGVQINMILNIYDFAGDLVFEDTFSDISPGRDSDQLVTWNLKNQSGAEVARGVYVFRLEAENTVTKNRTNAVGKLLVVD